MSLSTAAAVQALDYDLLTRGNVLRRLVELASNSEASFNAVTACILRNCRRRQRHHSLLSALTATPSWLTAHCHGLTHCCEMHHIQPRLQSVPGTITSNTPQRQAAGLGHTGPGAVKPVWNGVQLRRFSATFAGRRPAISVLGNRAWLGAGPVGDGCRPAAAVVGTGVGAQRSTCAQRASGAAMA